MTTVAAGGADELAPSGRLNGLAGIIRRHRKAIGSHRRCCPWRAGKLTEAIHALQLRET